MASVEETRRWERGAGGDLSSRRSTPPCTLTTTSTRVAAAAAAASALPLSARALHCLREAEQGEYKAFLFPPAECAGSCITC